MSNLKEIAKPYFNIYMAIKNRREVKMEDDDEGVYIAIPQAVNVTYHDLFSYLHNGKTDYIYIETIKDNQITTGLLCTDKDRYLSDTDSCFFVGEINGRLYFLTGDEFREYYSIDENFVVALPTVVEKVLADEICEKAFIMATRRELK